MHLNGWRHRSTPSLLWLPPSRLQSFPFQNFTKRPCAEARTFPFRFCIRNFRHVSPIATGERGHAAHLRAKDTPSPSTRVYHLQIRLVPRLPVRRNLESRFRTRRKARYLQMTISFKVLNYREVSQPTASMKNSNAPAVTVSQPFLQKLTTYDMSKNKSTLAIKMTRHRTVAILNFPLLCSTSCSKLRHCSATSLSLRTIQDNTALSVLRDLFHGQSKQ